MVRLSFIVYEYNNNYTVGDIVSCKDVDGENTYSVVALG